MPEAVAVVGTRAASTTNAAIDVVRARARDGRGAAAGLAFMRLRSDGSDGAPVCSGAGHGTRGTGPANARPGCRPGGRGRSAAYGLEPTMVGMAPVLATVTA
ncbi:hypothetical protein GCM10010330_18190 [Streptomyces tendae]|nr:hypothetical protein GCM10010330_18190 [Streptomyces tendae]